MAFILLKLKQNIEEPYAIYDLEKFGVWPFKKKRLIVGGASSESDITLVRVKTRKKKIGEITKTEDGWQYKFVSGKKKIEGIFINNIRIPVFDNVIEFKEEL